jgi:hypothetical protein
MKMKLYRKPILGEAVSAYKVLGSGKPSPTRQQAKRASEANQKFRSEIADEIFERLMRSSRNLAEQTGGSPQVD